MKQLKTLKVTEFIENKLYYCLNLADSPASMLLNHLHSITIMLVNSNSRKLRRRERINHSTKIYRLGAIKIIAGL